MYSGRTNICCTDEVTRMRGKYRQNTVRASRIDTYLATRSLISFLHSSTAVSVWLPVPSPPPHLVAVLGVLSCVAQPASLCASSLCHLAMKQSAASTTPRYHFPLFLAALGHNTVSTPNSKGEISVDPSVA